jgi:hypothetical protein
MYSSSSCQRTTYNDAVLGGEKWRNCPQSLRLVRGCMRCGSNNKPLADVSLGGNVQVAG